jgi:hypothetical protein
MHTNLLSENLMQTGYTADLRNIKRDLKNGNKLRECELNSTFSGEELVEDTLEPGNMPSDSVKKWEIPCLSEMLLVCSEGHWSVARIS